MAVSSVEVLYDYNYDTSEGKHISIHKGDIFTLLDKSTDEWWKVRRDEREKFYVPASYVRVNPQMEVIGASDSISIHTDIPSVPMNGHHREHSNASSYADSLSDGQSYSGSFDSKADTLNRVSQLQTKSSPSHVEASQTTNKMLNLNLQPSIVVTSDSGSPSPSPEEPEVTYANMQIIQDIIAERREKHVDFVSTEENNWQKLKDSDSGKMYYFNPVTKETTWDSPGIRRKNQLNALNHATPSPLSKRLSRVSSFRKGWTETVSEDGDKVYVHNATGEKWHMAVDESGKEYYYKENSQESLWELPEISEGDPSLPTNTNTDWPHGPRSSRTALSSKEEPHPRRASVDNLNARSRNNLFANKALTLPATFSSMSSTNEDQAGGYTLRNAAQSASAFDTQKRGYLFRAKLIEGKKKVKKSWCLSFLVAFDHHLFMYKDEKAAMPKQDAELGKPEIIVDLRQSSIDWASKERSNRKNVLEITSDNGNIYLLQHEDHILVRQWFTVLNGKIKKFNSSVTDEPEEATVPEIERNNNQKGQSSTLPASSKFKHAKRLSKSSSLKKRHTNNGGGRSVYTVHEDNAEFQAPSSLGPAGEGAAKVSIKLRLKKLLSRRPTQESLEKQGIYQVERVFGSRLQFICDRESTTVPRFLDRCIQAIESKGLDFDGLYRISGNLAQIQKLRLLVDQSDDYNLADYDVNVLTGALKLFFRELKEPLIPFQLYNALSETIRDKDVNKRARTMKLHLSTMPTVNSNTLKLLFSHLVRVLQHANQNRMKPQNIAIVFGPTLMWPEKESSAIAVNMMCQNSIVEYILLHFDRLF